MSLKTIIKRLEARCGIDEKPVTLDFGDGVCFTMTGSELARLLREINGTGFRPGGALPAQSVNRTEEDLTANRCQGSDPCPNDREKSV